VQGKKPLCLIFALRFSDSRKGDCLNSDFSDFSDFQGAGQNNQINQVNQINQSSDRMSAKIKRTRFFAP